MSQECDKLGALWQKCDFATRRELLKLPFFSHSFVRMVPLCLQIQKFYTSPCNNRPSIPAARPKILSKAKTWWRYRGKMQGGGRTFPSRMRSTSLPMAATWSPACAKTCKRSLFPILQCNLRKWTTQNKQSSPI